MKKPGKGKGKRKIGYNYLGMMGITVIALVMLGSLMMQARTLQNRLDYYNSKASARRNLLRARKVVQGDRC